MDRSIPTAFVLEFRSCAGPQPTGRAAGLPAQGEHGQTSGFLRLETASRSGFEGFWGGEGGGGGWNFH